MKKIITAALIIALGINSNAQGNEKDFRFGLKIEPSFNWLSPDKADKFESGGIKMGFGIGAMTDFKLGGNVWLSTGVAVDFSGAKLNYLDNTISDTSGFHPVYFHYSSGQSSGIVSVDDVNTALLDTTSTTFSEYSSIKLLDRTIRAQYVNIPLFIKMKTNEIGYLTYFGQFGLNTSIKTKARSTDNVDLISATNLTPSDLDDLDIEKEVNLFKLAGSIGGGFEYNLSESTSLSVAVIFDYGFTSLTKKTSDHVIAKQNGQAVTTFENYTDQKNKANAVRLTVGILF
tara:strand:- start:15 stop:875 length:861 start_codon:yes stop_codon:yes gene_type:complete